MKRLAVILRGPSGSGKSTFVDSLVGRCESGEIRVCSADTHFLGPDGVYRFDGSKLQAAHAACFRRWIDGLTRERGMLVCDNANASDVELHPYALAADAYGVEVLVVTLQVRPDVASARATHGAPHAAIIRQGLGCEKPPAFGRHEIRLINPSLAEVNTLAARIVRGVQEGRVTW